MTQQTRLGVEGIFTVAALATLLLMRMSDTAAAQSSSGGDSTWHLSLTAAYDDSKASLGDTRWIIRSMPPLVDTLAQPESIASYIARRFGVARVTGLGDSITVLPATYRLIDSAIKAWNPPVLGSNRAGQLLIPVLARRRFGVTVPPGAQREQQERAAEAAGPVGSLTVVQRVTRPHLTSQASEDALRALRAFSSGSLFQLVVRVPRELVRRVAFATTTHADLAHVAEPGFRATAEWLLEPQAAGDQDSLGSALADSVAAIASERTVRRVPLIILDSGWPDSLSRERSTESLLDLIDTVRASWGLGPRFGTPALGPFNNPAFEHVAWIRDALASLTAADTARGVDVIYVPLTRDQGSDGLLREILFSNELLRMKDSIAKAICMQADVDSARVCAAAEVLPTTTVNDALAMADAKLSAMPLAFEPSDPLATFRTSADVLAAIWNLVDAFAQVRRAAVFVNTSWTVLPHWEMPALDPRRSSRVVLITAAGNRGLPMAAEARGDTVTSLNLSRLVFRTKDVVAVTNATADGSPLCNSSFFHKADVGDNAAVAFSGFVPEDGACGTSFAAPRVAWFLALLESLRPSDVCAPTSVEIVKRLRQARFDSQAGPVRFAPIYYLLAGFAEWYGAQAAATCPSQQ